MFKIVIPDPYLFILVFCRVGAIIMLLPLTGSSQTPINVRAAFIAVVTYLIVFSVPMDAPPAPTSIAAMLFAAVKEIGLGVVVSFVTMGVLYAVEIGAQIIGFQMGFSIVNILDPLTGDQVSLIGAFEALFAVVVYAATGLYRPFLAAMSESFTIVGPGTADLTPLFQGMAVKTGTMIFLLGLKLAAPVMIALLVTKIALGIVARTVPQLNIFIVGFPLTIGVGLVVLAMAIPVILSLVLYGYNDALDAFWSLTKDAAP